MRTPSLNEALAGVSCAGSLVFLLIGIQVPYLIGFGYICGMVALMLPLAKDCYVGGGLAYLATCVLAVVLGGAARFWVLLPFIMFFGLHPLANALQLKFKIDARLAFIVKALWFDLMLLTTFFVVFNGAVGGFLLPDEVVKFINDFIYAVIFVGGTLFFLPYDMFVFRCQAFVATIVDEIKK